ncbi:hypothetical protein PUN28_016860 [Cardiocondyla obscurior]|uniref:Uncharacterized protein n=1 Tax=Cardiocondyla obscurior TaxID=286306 RepID=A0AAW2ESW6_9HYME
MPLHLCFEFVTIRGRRLSRSASGRASIRIENNARGIESLSRYRYPCRKQWGLLRWR